MRYSQYDTTPARVRQWINAPAVEHLARIGFSVILADGEYYPDDEDDPESREAARLEDHAFVRAKLLSEPAREPAYGDGCQWITPITWPDRVPGLKTWSGNMTLAKSIVNKYAKIIAREKPADLYEFQSPLEGASGLDPLACPNALDIGFSLPRTETPIYQRIGLELLAIVGLESVPIVSFDRRQFGYLHDGILWRFRATKRDGGYLYRWDTQTVGTI